MTATINRTGLAVRIHEHGGPEVLTLESITVPEPAAGQAVIRLAAAGVNFIDVYKRTGLYRVPLPATLGEEGCGTVTEIGPGVTEVAVGDTVAWASVIGSYAEFAVLPAARLVRVPDGLSASVAAALMLQGMTAHYLSASTYPLKQGDRCLIHAAAGGVGLLMVQIAKKLGAFVIGTAGTDEKAALAKLAGADEVIVYTRENFVDAVKRITNGEGVQVVYDSVGQSTFLPGFDVLSPRGMMVLFGQSSGPAAPVDPQLLNQKGSVFLTRPTLLHYTANREELLWRASDLFSWALKGELKVRIGAEYPLAEVAEAHRALEGRRTTGKVLLRV
jgi:NADPH2:quinone reductase